MTTYAFSGSFDDFPQVREVIEQHAVIDSIFTTDDVLTVVTQTALPVEVAQANNLTEV